MARTKWLKIRVSDDEIVDIKKRAGRHDMSTYARGLILDQPVAAPELKTKKIVHSADPELVRHVAWVGNNMNQIAKHLNLGNQVDNEVLMTLVKIQADLDTELQRIMSNDR